MKSIMPIIYSASGYQIDPNLAQLAEHQTVVAASQQSEGRWFDSGSSDFFVLLY